MNKKILNHCIDLIEESLIMTKINLLCLEDKGYDRPPSMDNDFQVSKMAMGREIEERERQLKVARKLLKT